MRFTTTVPLPDSLRELFEVVNGVAHLAKLDTNNYNMVIEFEEDDPYELALVVQELQQEINATFGYMAVQIPKPSEMI